MTDLCEYCEHGKNLKMKLKKMLKDINYEFQDHFDVEETLKYFINKALVLFEHLAPTQDLLLNDIIKFNYTRYSLNLL